MRYAIQLTDGAFVAFQVKVGTGSTYLIPTSDAVDAHDFKSEDTALRWLKTRQRDGAVVVLTDSGCYPSED